MKQMPAVAYATATSLTARLINRRIILNIIWQNQPISRADTARTTGLQRSTVSLIVDELIRDGWVVEGEHGRIPRGRRPVYLQLNAAGAGVYSVLIRGSLIELSASNLDGECLWVGRERARDCNLPSVVASLQHLHAQAKASIRHTMKGVGVAVDGIPAAHTHIRATVEELLGLPTAVGSVALACAKWFQLNHKDARLAQDHLLSIHIDNPNITMGAILGGQILQGAYGRAVSLLALEDGAEACTGHCEEGGQSANGTETATLLDEVCMARLVRAAKNGMAAYDPGVILVTGDLGDDVAELEKYVAEQLYALNARTAVRAINTTTDDSDVYRTGAMALVMAQFLESGAV